MAVEIEIKSLLGGAERAAQFRDALQAHGASLIETSRQLNHYFEGGKLTELAEQAKSVLEPHTAIHLLSLSRDAHHASVRTRLLNDTARLIAKIALDDTTSANGITRMEFDEPTPSLDHDSLDALVMGAGYQVQAKWSRHRELYQLGEVEISLDRNAGYGYLAEFEITAGDASDSAILTTGLRALMGEFGLEELPQARLERMFAFYNANWRDYYGTERVFVVD